MIDGAGEIGWAVGQILFARTLYPLRKRSPEMGAWPDNPTFPTGWDERDAKGV
jgi:hypothetical protein